VPTKGAEQTALISFVDAYYLESQTVQIQIVGFKMVQ
jgi:hypothetical protein